MSHGRVCLHLIKGVLIMIRVRRCRRHLLASALAAGVSALALWPGLAVAAPTGLVAAYGFDEGSGTAVRDSSGASNHGTVSGAAWTTAGRFGNALRFDGVNDLVSVPDADSLDLAGGMTLEVWVRPSTLGSVWRTAILKEQPGNLVYALYATTNSARPSEELYLGGYRSLAGVSTLAANAWTHLTATYDGATQRLYVGGAQVSSRAQTGALSASNGALRIGGNSVWGEWFEGSIDEVRVYNRALSAAEIQSDMSTPVGSVGDTSPPPPPPPAPADTSAPTVSVSSPADGATVSGSAVALDAVARDDVAVAGVRFGVDGAAVGAEDTTNPYSASWNSTTVANGTHRITAVARDSSGNTTTSATVTVTVGNDVVSPTVSLTAPANSATVSGAAVPVSADAADDTAIAAVQFKLDGANLGSADTTAPYRVDWNTTMVANGAHALTAVATDIAGNKTTAAGRSVTVANAVASSSGLVAAYGFSEGSGSSVADVSGNGNGGVVLGGATWSTAGRFGNALAFNGSNSSVKIPDSATLDLTTGMTLEAWVRPNSLTGWACVILKERPDTRQLAYELSANTQSDRPSSFIWVGSAEHGLLGNSKLPTGGWSHLAATYDGATYRFYVNGAQLSSTALAGAITTSNGDLRIGGNSLWGEWFNGLIDEVRIYRKALTAAEIQADMSRAA
jgi:hypothetical protein